MNTSSFCFSRSLLAALFALAVVSTVIAEPVPPPPPEREPLQFIRTVEPQYPLRLQAEGIQEGEAQIAISVDAQGQLQDYLVIGYSRPEFAEAAVVALKHWQFEPMRLRGEPYPSTKEMRFRFESQGLSVVDMTTSDYVQRRMDQLAPGMHGFRVLTLRELDRLPVPHEVVSPAYPQELAEQGIAGRVSVEFFIDETGRVRMPAVRETAHHVLSAAAVMAVRQWRFEPPQRNGQPVLVRAIQDFNFSPQPARKG